MSGTLYCQISIHSKPARLCPIMIQRPFVNFWFASSEGPNVESFNKCISEENQDRLEEGGVCIMYMHFASGFNKNNSINLRFKFLMERPSQKNGWFVPVSSLLDFLLELKGHRNIINTERNRLERKWLLHKIRVGNT